MLIIVKFYQKNRISSFYKISLLYIFDSIFSLIESIFIIRYFCH